MDNVSDIDSILDTNTTSDLIIGSIQINYDTVLKKLQKVDTKKGPGLGAILPLIFRSTALSICRPLHYLF